MQPFLRIQVGRPDGVRSPKVRAFRCSRCVQVSSFVAHGAFDQNRLLSFKPQLKKKCIYWIEVDEGDNCAGSIRVIKRASDDKEFTHYRIHINRNHEPAVQFVT